MSRFYVSKLIARHTYAPGEFIDAADFDEARKLASERFGEGEYSVHPVQDNPVRDEPQTAQRGWMKGQRW